MMHWQCDLRSAHWLHVGVVQDDSLPSKPVQIGSVQVGISPLNIVPAWNHNLLSAYTNGVSPMCPRPAVSRVRVRVTVLCGHLGPIVDTSVCGHIDWVGPGHSGSRTQHWVVNKAGHGHIRSWSQRDVDTSGYGHSGMLPMPIACFQNLL